MSVARCSFEVALWRLETASRRDFSLFLISYCVSFQRKREKERRSEQDDDDGRNENRFIMCVFHEQVVVLCGCFISSKWCEMYVIHSFIHSQHNKYGAIR